MRTAERARPAPIAIVVAGAALLLLVTFATSLGAGFWSPRAAVALLLVAVGLPCLLRLTRQDPVRGPALLATGLLVWSALATVLSKQPGLALFGRYNQGTGLLFIAALTSAWAAGVSVPIRDRWLVEQALVLGVLCNCAVGVLQAGVGLTSFRLALVDGHAPGLLGNPVHLGAIAAGGLALLAPRLQRRPLVWAPAVVLAGAAIEVSGARAALVVALALVGYELLRRRWTHTLTLGALTAAGLAVGAVVLAVGPGAGDAPTAAPVAASGGGLTARTGTWMAGLRSIVVHPLLGVGPGRFEAAAGRRRTLAVARAAGSGHELTDAHNLVVEYGTTIGIPGLALLLGWLGTAGRRARGPLLVFAAAVGAVGLLEPQSLGTTLVAAVALGAAWPDPPAREPDVRRRPVAAAVTVGLVAIAAVAAVLLLVGDRHLRVADADRSAVTARAAARILPPWPEPYTALARIYAYRATVARAQTAAETEQAVVAYRKAANRDPDDPSLWTALADLELADGRTAAAEADYRRAIAADHWSVDALNGLARTVTVDGRVAEALSLYRQSLRVVPDQPSIAALVARAGG